MKQKLLLVLSYVPDFFSYTLLIYLLLFLLENVFPGFVSDTFDPNLLLIPVVLLGIASSFAPEKEPVKKPPTRKDFVGVAAMTVLAGFIIYYKTKELGVTAIVLSVIGALLVLTVSLVILLAPEDSIVEAGEDDFHLKHIILKRSRKNKLINRRVAIISLSLGVILLAFLGTRYMRKTQQAQPNQQTVETRLTLGTAAEGRLTKPDIKILEETPIILLDGGLGMEKVNTLGQELTSYNVTVKSSGEADRLDYEGGTMYFRPQDASVSAYLTAVLAPLYPSMTLIPLPSSATGIILIVGKTGENP